MTTNKQEATKEAFVPTSARDLINMTPSQVEEYKKLFRAKFADVAYRGSIPNRLSVDLPPDLHGEWVRNDPASIRMKQDLGFVIDTEFAPKTGLHGDATTAVIGDVIHMVAPKFVREWVLEEQLKRREEIHGKPGVRKEQKEERDAKSEAAATPLKVINESSTANADAQQIATAIGKA
jgi:hypothetical protein